MRKISSGLWLAVAAAAVLLATACAQTDAGITTKVKSKLAADDTVKAYQIDVDTRNKVVTLTGNVDSQAAKEQAVSIARGTEGVADVVDNIIVAGGGTTGITGATGMETTPGMTGMETTPGMATTPGSSMMTTPGASGMTTPGSMTTTPRAR
jgi:hypothetical protein